MPARSSLRSLARFPILAALSLMLAVPAAFAAERVTSREAFAALVADSRLTALGVDLTLQPDGGIGGRAFGRNVSGSWDWQQGWFCRTMAWGAREFPLNCQLVTVDGARLSFTADKGTGDTATLTIR